MVGASLRIPAAGRPAPPRPHVGHDSSVHPRVGQSVERRQRGPSPATEPQRASLAAGRAMVGATHSTAVGRSSSREQKGRRSCGPESAKHASAVAERKPSRRGPPLPPAKADAYTPGPAPIAGVERPRGDITESQIKYILQGDPASSAQDDSLSDLLHKPLLPQNAALYERLADQMLDPRQGRISKPPGGRTDFDDEARKLFARLNLDPSKDTPGPHHSVDPIWRDPKTGGTIYVGNEVAARTLSLLESFNITHVVNCTDTIALYHEKTHGNPITYLRFDITQHYQKARTEKDAVEFVEPMLTFVSNALAQGKNVMVHCLAGAHRAGTTGIICLMHFAKLSPKEATYTAKRCRPIIDPICEFPLLLARLEKGWPLYCKTR